MKLKANKDKSVVDRPWKMIKTKHDNLVKLGINRYKAWEFANTRKGKVNCWRVQDKENRP